jgi:helix-turn-helix domain of resolvase
MIFDTIKVVERMTDYRKLCIDLFGTDNETELKDIAGRLKGGRKNKLTETDVKNAIEMQKNGKTTAEIAQTFNVSRQTISKYLNKPLNGNYVMRLDFMFRQKVCTEIYVNFADKKIKIVNRTNDIMKRAFGINENPDWNDFEQFLEERCFPKSRAFRKTILKKIGADGYDTLQILEKTDGRTAEDNQYIRFTRKELYAF